MQRVIMCGLITSLLVGVAGAQSPPPRHVSGAKITALIRMTIIALHHANITGNYTVLRDLGARETREDKNASRLADLFRRLREKNIKLGRTVLHKPLINGKPELSSDGVLRVKGSFPTRPDRVYFDITFIFEKGSWRYSAIRLGTRKAPRKRNRRSGRGRAR